MLAYLELFRLPNVFTAMACLSMGFLVTNEPPGRLGYYLLLLAASSLIYTAGMVLNDVFDLEVDLAERPDRPLPSGRIKVRRAIRLGFGLLSIGLLAACVVAFLAADWRPTFVAIALGAAVLAYDRSLKNTPLGPLVMGACRGLNVLLGMSVAVGPWEDWHYTIAAGIGVYITGVTWFARAEATTSERLQLSLALGVMLLGLGLLAYYPEFEPPDLELALVADPQRWHLLWLALGLMTTWRCMRAIADPSPELVQYAVKHCLLSLIVIDAAIVTALRPLGWAILILILLLPAMYLGRWIYST